MISLIPSLLLLLAIPINALGPKPPKVRPAGLPTYNPGGINLNAQDFSSWVAGQYNLGVRAVALQQGQYNVASAYQADYKAYMTFFTMTGMTVWMDSVQLALPDPTITAISIDRCVNLVTYGPTLWWTTPGFGQATITQSSLVGQNTYQIQFTCDAGYDCSSMVQSGQLNVEYTNPTTGLLQPGPGYSVFVGPATTISSNTWQYTYYGAYFAPQVGFKLLSRGPFLYCNIVQGSNYTSINDFTMHNCGGINWMSYLNLKPSFNSITLKPAPFAPPGGTELPVRAGNSDGIHSNSDLVGPQIDSCLFSRISDDCIAIQGRLGYTSNVSGLGAGVFVGNIGVSNGDVLRFYVPGTYKSLGTAKVLSSDNSRYPQIYITVKTLPTGFVAGQTLYVNRNQQGSGFSITNTQTTGNRGRGAIVKGSDGVIANNVFGNVTYAGIFLGPEFTQWNETDFVSNVTVTNNSIINCGYIDTGYSAFSLHGDSLQIGSSNNSLNPINGNSNIVISGLYISGTGTQSNIYIGAATNVSMTGVTISNALQASYAIDETTPTALANFQNVKFAAAPGICQQNTGSRTTPGGVYVYDVHYYGTVTNGVTGIPAC